MKQYLTLLKHIKRAGVPSRDRTGTGTLSIFGYQMRFNFINGFPLLTTKKIHIKSVIHELLWFLSGDTNIKYLNNNDVRIWNEWADDKGDLGNIYGHQWRSWKGYNNETIDQILTVIENIKNDPHSRRHIVSAWNVADLENMSLPPCHVLFQFYVRNKKLSCHLYQRSADVFLGVPFNIASYALLTQMIAKVCNLQAHELIMSFGDVHIYNNHLQQVDEQISRIPRELPKMILKGDIDSIFDFEYKNFDLFKYNPYPAIKGKISI